jgi:hypothetical protein
MHVLYDGRVCFPEADPLHGPNMGKAERCVWIAASATGSSDDRGCVCGPPPPPSPPRTNGQQHYKPREDSEASCVSRLVSALVSRCRRRRCRGLDLRGIKILVSAVSFGRLPSLRLVVPVHSLHPPPPSSIHPPLTSSVALSSSLNRKQQTTTHHHTSPHHGLGGAACYPSVPASRGPAAQEHDLPV